MYLDLRRLRLARSEGEECEGKEHGTRTVDGLEVVESGSGSHGSDLMVLVGGWKGREGECGGDGFGFGFEARVARSQ